MAVAGLSAEAKLQSSGEPLCQVLRLCVTWPGCLCRSGRTRAETGLTLNEPGLLGPMGSFLLHQADWHPRLPGWCHWGLGLQVHSCMCVCATEHILGTNCKLHTRWLQAFNCSHRSFFQSWFHHTCINHCEKIVSVSIGFGKSLNATITV